jgi:hypothetical protein
MARPPGARAEHDELQDGCLGLAAELRALREARRLCEAARQEAAAATAAAAGLQPAAAGRQVMIVALKRVSEEHASVNTLLIQSLVGKASHMHADRVCTTAQVQCGDASGSGAASQPPQPALPPGFLRQLQCALPPWQALHAGLALWMRLKWRGAQERMAYALCLQVTCRVSSMHG